MTYALYAVAAVLTLFTLVAVSAIGKPREPLTPGNVVVDIIINGTMVALVLIAARMLH